MGTLARDLRYGLRLLIRNPGFTAVVVIALALGIGANSAVFSSVNAVLLRPLPFHDLDRIVAVSETPPNAGSERASTSLSNFRDWSSQASVFEQIAAYRRWNVTLTGNHEPERVEGYLVSPDFFRLLEMEPALGRVFSSEEGAQNQVIVVSHALWQRRLGSDPAILQRPMTLNGRAFTVVGIMPPEFDFPLGGELWTPLPMTPEQEALRGRRDLHVIARLKPGVSLSEAQAEMSSIAARLAREYPQTNAGWSALLVPLREEITFGSRQFLLVLMAAAGFVLLLACVNVANLQLARGVARQKELAVRAALGASRVRLARQLLTEGLLFALVGGGLGLLLAAWDIEYTRASIPAAIAAHVAGLRHIEVDGRVVAFTLVISVFAGLLSAVAGAFSVSDVGLHEALKQGGRSGGTVSGRRAMRSALVVSEVALALVLLVGAGLMVKGFNHLLRVNRGYDPENLLTARLALPDLRYPEGHQTIAFYDQVLRRIEAVAGVRSAAAISALPSVSGSNSSNLVIEGRPLPRPDEPVRAEVRSITQDYFRTLRIPLLKGRFFTAGETQQGDGGLQPVIISESMARRYWPNENPLGRRLQISSPDSHPPWLTIVGVVGDVSHDWFLNDVRPTLYVPYRHSPYRAMNLVVRTEADPEATVAALRSAVAGVDPDQPIYDVRTLEGILADNASGVRFAAGLMARFGLIALALAAAGIYAVVSYSVTQRTQEIGVRMALGAGRRDVLKMVVGSALKLAAIGLAIGLPAALALSRIMSSVLFGVVAVEPVVFAAFSAVLAAVALLAAYVPARRAARVDPMVALRYE